MPAPLQDAYGEDGGVRGGQVRPTGVLTRRALLEVGGQRSTLDAGGDDALDDVALHQEKDNEHWQNIDHDRRQG